MFYRTLITLITSSRSQMFFKIGFFINFAVFTGIPVLESLFNKVTGRQHCNFIKKRLQPRWFLVNIAKFLRTAFFIEHLRWLLLTYDVYNISDVSNLCTIIFCSEAVFRRCSVKTVFLKILQNSQENTCVRVYFLVNLQV